MDVTHVQYSQDDAEEMAARLANSSPCHIAHDLQRLTLLYLAQMYVDYDVIAKSEFDAKYHVWIPDFSTLRYHVKRFDAVYFSDTLRAYFQEALGS